MSTISVENVSVSVFQEGVTSKETARLPALRQGLRNENTGRSKRRLERDASATSTKGKRPRLDVSDTPAKNVFKAVHGGTNMERVGPCGEPVEGTEVKPVAASRQDVKPAEPGRVRDPREEGTAAKHEAGNRVAKDVKKSTKEVEANPSVGERRKGGVKDRREVAGGARVADRPRRDHRRRDGSAEPTSGYRAQQRCGGSVEPKRPPPPPPPRSTSRSRPSRDDRGRGHDRDRDHGRGHDHDRDQGRDSRRSRHRRGERDEHDRRRSRSRSRSRCVNDQCLI